MSSVRRIAIRAGTVGGVLFAAHISIPECGNYPFIWPAVAGAVAFWSVSRATAVHRVRQGSLGGLATGVIVALIGLVGISLIVFMAGHSQSSAVTSTSGLHDRLVMLMQAGSMIATLCVMAFVAALLGTAAMVPVMWVRNRRVDAPAA